MADRVQFPLGMAVAHLERQQPGGLTIRYVETSTIVAVIARRGKAAVVEERVASFATGSPGTLMLQTGPEQWLLLHRQPDLGWFDMIVTTLENAAAVFDQSSGYEVITLEGGDAQKLLQKGVFINLEIALAQINSGITTAISQINIVIWRSYANQFGVAIPRSFAGSFWYWLVTAGAADNIVLGR